METYIWIGLWIFAFFVGSAPSGYLIMKKFGGVDIRTLGSGNIGSTNVNRIGGKKLSKYTQILDIIKGLLPVLISLIIIKNNNFNWNKDLVIATIAIAPILGHDYTPFLKFNGGKGVNTTMGSFVLLIPIPVFAGVLVYYILRPLTSIVSIRSLSLGLTIPIIAYFMNVNIHIVSFAFIAWLIMILRHKENLVRIFYGTENR